jgi:hypothetical protein
MAWTLQLLFLDALNTMFPVIAQLWMNMATVFLEQLSVILNSTFSLPTGNSTTAGGQGDLSCDAVEAEPILLFDHFCVCTAVLRKILEKGLKDMITLTHKQLPTANVFETHFLGSSGFVSRFYAIYRQLVAAYKQLCLCVESVAGPDAFAVDEYGVSEDDNLEDEIQFFDGCMQTARSYAEDSNKSQPNTSQKVAAMYGTMTVLREMASLPVNLIDSHPLEMAPLFLPLGLETSFEILVSNYQSSQSLDDLKGVGTYNVGEHKTVMISCVVFLSLALDCSEFSDNAPKRKQGKGGTNARSLNCSLLTRSFTLDDPTAFPYDSIAATAFSIRQSFFSAARLETIMDLLLRYLLSYTKNDLLEWRHEPDGYFKKQTS